MVHGLKQGAEGSASKANLETLEELLKGIKVIAIGPGLSTKGEASEFARGLVEKTKLPMVIDADALNAFDEEKARALNGAGRTMVLTPHPGEMARLLGLTVADVEKDRMGLARKFATEHQVTLVLKGWRTLVAHPDGSIGVNTTGSPALAKGRKRRYPDGDRGGDAGAVSRQRCRGGRGGGFICMGWRRTFPRRRWTRRRCWRPTWWRA